MKRFRFTWKTGETEEAIGTSVAEALSSLGYGAGAVPALESWVEIK